MTTTATPPALFLGVAGDEPGCEDPGVVVEARMLREEIGNAIGRLPSPVVRRWLFAVAAGEVPLPTKPHDLQSRIGVELPALLDSLRAHRRPA